MLFKMDILTAIMAKIKAKYPKCNVYMGEVVDGFKEDAFFGELVKTSNVDNKNTLSNSLSIIITYLSACNKQSALINVEDALEAMFASGLEAGGRFLTVSTVSSVRLGERQDLSQTTITIEYKDSTGYDYDNGYVLAENVEIEVEKG